jgi:hypothetical protein
MKFFRALASSFIVVAGLAIALPAAHANPVITVNLGVSAQDFTLVGQGTDNPYGTYINLQGACTSGASTTSCLLSGAFTGSTAGFTDGSYSLITTYPNGDPLTSISVDPLGGPYQNYFNLNPPAAGTTMYLDLTQNGGGTYDIPIFTNDAYDAQLYFNGTNPTCGGTSLGEASCSQINVGQVYGATYGGPVTGSVNFVEPTSVTPEPASLLLLGTGFLSLAGFVSYKRS